MKNALVIGGLSGVGKGIATALAAKGYHVIIGDLHVNEPSSSAQHLLVNAVDSGSVQTMLSHLQRQVEHIDVLVVTIGVIDEGSIINLAAEKWRWMFDYNLFGVINVVDAVLPIITKDTGKILLTGSGSGMGQVNQLSGLGLYTVTKHALSGYAKALREELKPQGIQVSLLVPSGIAGKLSENSAEIRTHVLNESYHTSGQQPKGRQLEPGEKAAEAFVDDFLAGKTYVTNQLSGLVTKLEQEITDLVAPGNL